MLRRHPGALQLVGSKFTSLAGGCQQSAGQYLTEEKDQSIQGSSFTRCDSSVGRCSWLLPLLSCGERTQALQQGQTLQLAS